MKRCLIIFAKEPQKGRVKTRMKSIFDDAICLRLYRAFLQDTVAFAQKIKCEERIIAYDSASSSPQFLMTIAPEFNFYRQRGRDFGRKMHNAFNYAHKIKAEKIVIIGADSPDLRRQYINEAFQKLETADVVLGPCQDGGYYLIGLKSPCIKLFQGIKWSSDGVTRTTLKKARECNKKVSILKEWYDIDTPKFLARFVSEKKKQGVAQFTRRVLQCMNLKPIIQ